MLLAELHGMQMAAMPLYHFTPLRNFYQILKTNTLIPRARLGHDDKRKSVSFTRDPRRSFIPAGAGEGIGLRFDRSKLAQHYKLTPSIHNTIPRTSYVGGKLVTPQEARMSSRFESEERIFDRPVENVKRYLTGIVIPQTGKWGRGRMPSIQNLAMTVLDISGAFGRNRGHARDVRDYFLNTIRELNVPIVFQGKEFAPEQIDKAIGKVYWMKKNKPEEFNQLMNQFFKMDTMRGGRTDPSYFGNVHVDTGRATYGELIGKGQNESLQEMSMQELRDAEYVIEYLFKDLGIDVVWTTHFKDRIAGRESDVTKFELAQAFKKMKERYGDRLKAARDNHREFVGILKDMAAELNIPFAVEFDRRNPRNNKYILRGITIMRKDPKRFRANVSGGAELPV